MSVPSIVIVGAGPGVSMGVAQRFAQEGFRVTLAARNAAKLNALSTDLRNDGHLATSFTLDATDPDNIRDAFAEYLAVHGTPDVLLYNAARLRPARPTEASPADVLDDLRVNVVGALACAQAVIPGMTSRGNGALLFTGGGLALNPVPEYSSLALGKAALRNLVYSLNADLKQSGVYAGTVTIAGFVQAGTHFSPKKIAAAFWELYGNAHEVEIIYK